MEKEIKILKALGHPMRLEIIQLLSDKDSLCVCKLQEYFASTQSNLSQHLRILREAELLTSEKIGGWVHYSLKNKDVLKILDILRGL
ncbi:ArsR/SmtB family transcription factor [Cetobacterium sp. SF1]|uniref:ArsR/SmtB family transcription factor n=1 Tax=Cetobacterium sp. SF1 TaxID=3417654 RepID=UPI003CEF5363